MSVFSQGLGVAAIFGLPGGSEWLLILAVVLLLFGPTQLPKLAKMFGKSAKALKDGIDGNLPDDDDESVKAESQSDAEAKDDKDDA
jgi:sec-independent protein translocase protein TatA